MLVLPAIAQIEVGENDFHISSFAISPVELDASAPDVAYNSTNHEYLVVFEGFGIAPICGAGLPTIRMVWAVRLNAETGASIGNSVAVSRSCDQLRDAFDPAVVYNPTENEYLVVWSADEVLDGQQNPERDIFGQLLSADLALVGSEAFRISDMGDPGDTSFDGDHPAVSYNSGVNEYLVVWHGDDDEGDLVDGEREIFGQRLDENGLGLGFNDFRISEMGGTGDGDFDALHPAVTYNSVDSEYLVVWWGIDNEPGLDPFESEIFGQRLDASGDEVGGNDFRISDMGGIGDDTFEAYDPAVTYSPVNNEYLVVWWGTDNQDGLVPFEYEVFGQRLDENGLEQGANDFRISEMGGTGDDTFEAVEPAVTYNSVDKEYLVTWWGEGGEGGLVDGEYEIFGQRLDENGLEQGINDFRISDMGGTGSNLFDGSHPTVAYNPVENGYLVAWRGDDNVGGLDDDEFEIFGQRLLSDVFHDGFETGDTSAWSD